MEMETGGSGWGNFKQGPEVKISDVKRGILSWRIPSNSTPRMS